MPLTVVAINAAKAGEKPYRLYDEKGLYLEVTPKNSKLWRFKYRVPVGGKRKEKRLALGIYPEVGLKKARSQRDEARRMLADGIDPSAVRKAGKAGNDGDSFEVVAREWFAKHEPNWAESHSSKIIARLQNDVFPWIGTHPVDEVTSAEMLSVLRRVEERGALDTAHRVRQTCGQIFRYAIATRRAEIEPCFALKGALPPARKTHYPTITDPKAIGRLLRAIDGYQGHFVTRCALKIAPLVFLRSSELCGAQWSEIDFDAAMWGIPAERMGKTGREHLVPLSHQVISILREIQPLTGSGRFIFPGMRTRVRPISGNALNGGLRNLGYTKEELVIHSFRSMATTLLNEQGWNSDAIERQLSHLERNEVRRAYDRAEHLKERTRMMRWWADYLDKLKTGEKVEPFRH